MLLHALAEVSRVRAVHVNHGLHADADRWAEHCRAVAERLVANEDLQDELIRRVETGDQDAFRVLYVRYFPRG